MSSFSFNMSPIEWAPSSPNYALGISGIVTTGYTFSASGTVVDSSATPVTLGSFSISAVTGFTFIGASPINWSTATFPILVSGTITNSSSSNSVSTSSQVSLGNKGTGVVIPVCYQVSVFCNDAGNDNDWNDFVLNFQLFDSSTD